MKRKVDKHRFDVVLFSPPRLHRQRSQRGGITSFSSFIIPRLSPSSVSLIKSGSLTFFSVLPVCRKPSELIGFGEEAAARIIAHCYSYNM